MSIAVSDIIACFALARDICSSLSVTKAASKQYEHFAQEIITLRNVLGQAGRDIHELLDKNEDIEAEPNPRDLLLQNMGESVGHLGNLLAESTWNLNDKRWAHRLTEHRDLNSATVTMIALRDREPDVRALVDDLDNLVLESQRLLSKSLMDKTIEKPLMAAESMPARLPCAKGHLFVNRMCGRMIFMTEPWRRHAYDAFMCAGSCGQAAKEYHKVTHGEAGGAKHSTGGYRAFEYDRADYLFKPSVLSYSTEAGCCSMSVVFVAASQSLSTAFFWGTAKLMMLLWTIFLGIFLAVSSSAHSPGIDTALSYWFTAVVLWAGIGILTIKWGLILRTKRTWDTTRHLIIRSSLAALIRLTGAFHAHKRVLWKRTQACIHLAVFGTNTLLWKTPNGDQATVISNPVIAIPQLSVSDICRSRSCLDNCQERSLCTPSAMGRLWRAMTSQIDQWRSQLIVPMQTLRKFQAMTL